MRKHAVRGLVSAAVLAAVVLLPTSSAIAATRLQVIGTDFALSRIPASLASGGYGLDFYNRSRTQAHEVVVLRPVNQSETNAQIINHFDNDDQYAFDFEGVAFAPPLKSDLGESAWLASGKTVFVCFVTDPATGKPHYKLGMIEFRTVA